MKKTVITALSLGLLVPGMTPASAASGMLVEDGNRCGFVAVTDLTAEGDVHTGEMHGGPITAAETGWPGEETAGISLGCTIQVGAQGSTHAGADAVSVASATNPAGAVLPPTLVSFVTRQQIPVYLCTRVAVNGQTRYYDSTNAVWSFSSAVDCALAITQEVVDYEPPAAPFYPMGIIEIAGAGSGPMTYRFEGFFPDISQWTCSYPQPGTVSCDPPPPPPRTANVCNVVTVAVTNTGLGSVSGSSRCRTGESSNATSNGPATTPAVASGVPGGEFPWSCSAIPQQPVPAPWTVRCTMSH